MSSRERLLAAIEGAPGAPLPCSFMMFRALRERCQDEFEFALRQVEMGMDARVRLDDLPVRFDSRVGVRDWIEASAGGGPPLLSRTYQTPAGELWAAVRMTDDWPYGDGLPIFGDYITPRAVKFLVTRPDDLEPLRYLFVAPEARDVDAFAAGANRHKDFARAHGMLLSGGWKSERDVPGEDKLLIGDNGGTGTVIDTLMWLCGATEPLMWAYDDPEFLRELLAIIEEWNRTRLEVHLGIGVDLIVRRAWYEGTEFWSPAFYRQFILPALTREVKLVHQAGARYGYILTSGMVPMADLILESGVDAIIGIDPGEGKGTDLAQVRQHLGGRVGLWGGVSGPLSVEQGDEGEVKRAVSEAMEMFGPTGRFILSPVDNIREHDEQVWRNVRVFVETWKGLARE